MNDINLKNQNNNIQDETVLHNYEVVKKISFITNLIYKIKNSKTQKLLPTTELKPQKTFKSIHYMWNMANFRTSLFNILDSIRNFLSNSFQKNPVNSLEAQIIGKSNNVVILSETPINFIIPKPIKLKKNNNEK